MYYRFLLLSVFTCFLTGQIHANGLIRDAEIEHSLKLIAKPILHAAGLHAQDVKILVVNNDSMNAFVIGNKRIFIHHGLIKKLNKVEELQAVLAHEIAHITESHFIQRNTIFNQSQTTIGLGLLLGAIVATTSNNGKAGTGLAMGISEAATRNLLTHTRAQEASADQLSLRYLADAGISPKATLDVLTIFKEQNFSTAKQPDPYTATHPLTAQRINTLKTALKKYHPKKNKNASQARYWFDRMKAKFIGFTNNPVTILRRLNPNDTSEIATYKRAIAYHHLPDHKKAATSIATLLKNHPNDPYYLELKAQFLLETGHAEQAITIYKQSLKYAPDEPQIIAGLGRAQLARHHYKEGLKTLQKAYSIDPHNTRMLRDLALAYAQENNLGWAGLITAERYAIKGDFKSVIIHAKRAESLLPKGNTGWLKAKDLLISAKHALNQ